MPEHGTRGGPPAAVVDLGTNTALLVVARRSPADGSLEVLEEHGATPRLGEGLARTGRLARSACERALDTLREFAARMEAWDVPADRRVVAGTAALRRAADAAAWVARVRAELGLEVRVLPEEEEAELGYSAATDGGRRPARAVVDVGGGSSEIAWAGGRRRVSLPVGAVVLHELAPEDPGERARLIGQALRALPSDLPGREAPSPAPVRLVGGTGVHLASLERGAGRFELAGLEGAVVRAESAERWAVRLDRLPPEARRALPIEPERADILPAGLALLGALLARLGAEEAEVTLRGLRHALVRRLLESDPEGTGKARRES